MLNFKYLFFVALWFSLTACQPATATPMPTAVQPALTPTATGVAATPTAEATRPLGGVATVGLVGRPANLNPITENHPALRQITPLLFESLLQADPVTAELRPALAESWEYSADGRLVTFHLPAKLAWSSGAPLTAAGVVASLQATQHPALLKFSQISAPNDHTITLEFLQIDCAAVTQLALLPLLPADQILASRPLGSGPFVVKNWSADGRTLTLARNARYHGVTARLDSLTVRFIDAAQQAIVLSEGAGQFDVIGPVTGPLAQLPADFEPHTYPAPKMVSVAINYAPRNETRLPDGMRQALIESLDRPALLAEALGGDGVLLAGPLLPGHWAADATLALPDYNPAAAKALLPKAGLRDSNNDGWLDSDGQRLNLAIRLNGKNSLHQQLGWLASSYYRDLGLFARAESVPPDSVIDDLFSHDYRLAIFNWPILPDPDQRPYWHSRENKAGEGLNFTSYSNPQLDSLLEQAAAVPGCRQPERAKLYAQAQQILSRERPVDFVLAPNEHVLSARRLHGLRPGPFAPLTWNAGEWYLAGENQ